MHRGEGGKIAIRGGGRHYPAGAKVKFEKTGDETARRRIFDGLKKTRDRRAAKAAGNGGGSRRARAAAAANRASEPKVLAMFDVSIENEGKKWQPAAGEPVTVNIDLDEPVAVAAGTMPAVVHLADDGTVEELPESRRGFTFNKDKTAVVSFWFAAEGFSVYAIAEGDNGKTDSTPARRLYDFYSRDFNRYLEDGVTPNPDWNKYVPRYFTTVEGNKTFRQIVKDGQYLVRPEALPSPLGRTFMGWFLFKEANAGKTVDGVTYDEEGFATTPFDFNSPVVFKAGETGETEYQLRSRFDRVGYVIFHEQPVSGSWPITAVRRAIMEESGTTNIEVVVDGQTVTQTHGLMNANVKIDDIKVTYDDTQDEDGKEHANSTPRMIFRGWSLTPVMPGSTTNINGGAVELLSSPFTFTRVKDTTATPRHLYPVFVGINWLTFKAAATGEGATYIPPRYYYADDGADSFPVPQRAGYTFNGWWTTSNDTVQAGARISGADGSIYTGSNLSGWTGSVKNGRLMLTDNSVIYGRWKPAETNYTVVVWKQKNTDAPNLAEADKTYDFAESFVERGLSEQIVTVAQTYKSWSGQAANSVHESAYTGFTYARCDAGKTVVGNGSTVLNVYYDRNVHTLTFRVPVRDYYTTYYTTVKTVTGLYDSNVEDEFPIPGYEGKTWKGDVYYTERLATFETMPDTDIRFTLADGQNKSGTLYYYVEVDSDYEGEKISRDGRWYALHKTIKHDYNFLTKKEDFHDIRGYTQLDTDAVWTSSGKTATLPNNNVHSFYYTRNEYEVSFFDSYGNTLLGGEPAKVKFSAGIAPHVPANPASTRRGYYFTGWYADEACSTRVFFKDDEAYRSYKKNKVLFDTMPANNLRFFAGWETEWYLIQIDPNGGQLADGQSLWFWEAYNGEPIEEYTTVTRSFVEAADGKWFYALQDRKSHGYTDEWVEGESSDRRAYYTTDISDTYIVPGKRYSQAVNAYRYAGWYEVTTDANGNETEKLYGFGQPVQKNTTLRLHWKHIGTYRLHYEAGAGSISEGDENELILRTLDGGIYADESEILVTRTAVPPKGSVFLGWRIRGGDGTIFHPGHSFVFSSKYTIPSLDANGNRIDQLVLDAVYDKVHTVSLTTDANGGVVDGSVATTLPLAYPNAPTLITNITDTARTVSGMRNNAYGHLSDGSGYYCTVTDDEGHEYKLDFLGWNTKADGTGTHFDGGQYVGVDHLDTPDDSGKNILYAEWGVPVFFDKNNDEIGWSHDKWKEKWGDKFVYDEARNQYMQIAILNGYATYPEIIRDSQTDGKMFAHWSTVRFKEWEQCPPFDFVNTPITKPTTLYAIWRDFIKEPFHAVDASGEQIVHMPDWLKLSVLSVSNETDIWFDDKWRDYVDVPQDEGYVYAFTCLGDSEGNISESDRITRLWFNADRDQRCTWVEYADGRTEAQPSDKTVHFVFYKNPKTPAIGYRELGADGLADLDGSVSAAAPKSATVGEDGYDMTAEIEKPMGWMTGASGYKHYAFAIGAAGAKDASSLRFITEAKEVDGDRPALRLKNTWRGMQYSTDGGENWTPCGYDVQLYVLYFKAQPTIVTFKELTEGLQADMAEKFEYEVVVSNVVTTVIQTQTRTLTTDNTSNSFWDWGWHSYPESYKYLHTYTKNGKQNTVSWTYYFGDNGKEWGPWGNKSSTTDVKMSLASSDGYFLSGGTAESATLVHEVINPVEWTNGGTNASNSASSTSSKAGTLTLVETRTHKTITNAQVLCIVQKAKDGFATTNDNGDGKFVFECESSATASTTNVTYKNVRDNETVELHVAVSQGLSIDHDDNNWRTEDEAGCKIKLPLNEKGVFTVTEDALFKFNTADEGGLLKAVPDGKVFAGVFYGKPDETNKEDENRVVLGGRVTSIGFVKPAGGKYYDIYLNNDTKLPLGDNKLYYVYITMPKAYFMKEGANGALTQIENITYNGNAVVGMGFGALAAQGMEMDVGESAVAIASTGAGVFRVPVALDGAKDASRNLAGIGACASGAGDMSAVPATAKADGSLLLKVENAQLKWSLDGETWNLFAGEPAVYAIYKETGFDLTVSFVSFASDEDRKHDLFVVKIESENLKSGGTFEASGYETETVSPVDGVLTLAATGGCTVTVHALQDNLLSYTIREILPENYTMKSVTIDGAAPVSQIQIENGAATFLVADKKVEFTNVKSYSVKFVDEDGETVLEDEKAYEYGTAADGVAQPGGEPEKKRTADALYRFDGWNTAVEPVTSNIVYKAVYREIRIPQAIQRKTGANLVVGLDETPLLSTMKALGFDMLSKDYSEEKASEFLNQKDANGLRRWENMVTGTAYNQPPLTVGASYDGVNATLGAVVDPSTATNLYYKVLYELEKSVGEGWTRVAGPAESKDAGFTLALKDAKGASTGATGYYRLNTLIVPLNDPSVTNVIQSSNIAGVVEVASLDKHTMASVPFNKFKLVGDDSGCDSVHVSEYLGDAFLSTDDYLRTLEGDKFRVWQKVAAATRSAGSSWKAYAAVKAGTATLQAIEADEFSLDRGRTVWVERANPSDHFFIIGQYSGEPVEVTIKGCDPTKTGKEAIGYTAVPNPCIKALDLNSIDWGGNPVRGDNIRILNANGGITDLVWSSAKQQWGSQGGKAGFTTKKAFVLPGTSFWYYRVGSGDFTISIKPVEAK